MLENPGRETSAWILLHSILATTLGGSAQQAHLKDKKTKVYPVTQLEGQDLSLGMSDSKAHASSSTSYQVRNVKKKEFTNLENQLPTLAIPMSQMRKTAKEHPK